jgi:hypothetical protein
MLRDDSTPSVERAELAECLTNARSESQWFRRPPETHPTTKPTASAVRTARGGFFLAYSTNREESRRDTAAPRF